MCSSLISAAGMHDGNAAVDEADDLLSHTTRRHMARKPVRGALVHHDHDVWHHAVRVDSTIDDEFLRRANSTIADEFLRRRMSPDSLAALKDC